ncbi:MAG: hypothetical protein ACLT8P_07010 [Holdemanella porci]
MNNVVSDRIKKAIEKSGYSFVELKRGQEFLNQPYKDILKE